MTKYLGIDYGLVRIGIATSEATLATPLPSLHNDEKILSKINNIVKSELVTTIICGIPEGMLAAKVESFAEKLRVSTGVPVILHQETLSTQEVKQKLHEIGASRAKKKDDHAYAACLILEDYLELNNSVN